MQRPNIKRRVALAGGTALIAAAGVGAYLGADGGSASAHLTATPVSTVATPTGTSAPAPGDNQQGVQGGQEGDNQQGAQGGQGNDNQQGAQGGQAGDNNR